MGKPNLDHVVLDLNDSSFRCKHCGDRYAMSLPAPLDLMVAASKAYAKTHRHCKPPKEEPTNG